jgi:hypothetical protein
VKRRRRPRIPTSSAHGCLKNGYGAFSVNPAQVERVIQYIANQKEHHRKKAFKTEYQEFLKKNEVPYDERFVWE